MNATGKHTRRTDAEVMDVLRSNTSLNRARAKISGFAGRIEQEGMQHRPAGPIEIRRIEIEAVEAIAAELAAPDMYEALAAILGLLGNVDHSKGGGENAARLYGGMLMSIKELASPALAKAEGTK